MKEVSASPIIKTEINSDCELFILFIVKKGNFKRIIFPVKMKLLNSRHTAIDGFTLED